MIETIMYFGIGFLCASLLGLVIVPLVHNRAVRLTIRRLEAATPVSVAEIQADKDQLRAEFAIATRRLELTIEQVKAQSTGQFAELGKKAEAITILKTDIAEKAAAILALEARQRELEEQLRAAEEDGAAKAAALQKTELARAEKAAALAKMTGELDERTRTADAQRVEITALRAHVDALQLQLELSEKEMKDTQHRLARKRSDLEAATQELGDERGKVESLGNRLAQLERQLVAQATEAEIVACRAQDLEARLSERDHAVNRLTSELDAARRAEADLRAEIAAMGGRHRESAAAVGAEISRLQTTLEQASEERARLQQDVATMKRDAEAAAGYERAENALLRERIKDIAAEVAWLTMTLEGPGSPIAAILASEPAAGSGVNGANQGHGEHAPANLADRIRALQSKASRLSPVS